MTVSGTALQDVGAATAVLLVVAGFAGVSLLAMAQAWAGLLLGLGPEGRRAAGRRQKLGWTALAAGLGVVALGAVVAGLASPVPTAVLQPLYRGVPAAAVPLVAAGVVAPAAAGAVTGRIARSR